MFNQTRLKVTFIAFFILLAFILFDIFQLQTTEFQSTSEIIDQQNLDKFYITAPRGEIFDANGEKIVETKLEPHLFINMRKITNENSASYTQIIQYNWRQLLIKRIKKSSLNFLLGVYKHWGGKDMCRASQKGKARMMFILFFV